MGGHRPSTASARTSNKSAEATMLGDNNAVATVAVRDLAKAKKFYGDVLGLKALTSTEKEVANYQAGKSALLVYSSQFAGSNKATAVTGNVEDVAAVAS